jgi:ketopantoate reductase
MRSRRAPNGGIRVKTSVLILGASYGSLLSTKLLMAGHDVTLVCTRSTAELINREGTVVRFPVSQGEPPLSVVSQELPGALHACTPLEADPGAYDLIVLGMQEAQYGSREVRELMGRIARARKPCFAIMNMPPLPFLKAFPESRPSRWKRVMRTPGRGRASSRG